MRTVHVQCHADGQILNVNLYAAYDGFSKKAYDLKLFSILPSIESTDDLVCGTVAVVRQAWFSLGVEPPALLDYPESLRQWLGRCITQTTVGEVKARLFREEDQFTPCFIKPSLSHKLFTGYVVAHSRDLIQIAGLDDKVAIWQSDLVNFVSEWRVFVLDKRILGIKHYAGNPFLPPTEEVVQSMIADFTDSPKAYSLDVGIDADGKPLLVEVNDAYALGNYGLDSFKYAQLVEARWDEVVGK